MLLILIFYPYLILYFGFFFAGRRTCAHFLGVLDNLFYLFRQLGKGTIIGYG